MLTQILQKTPVWVWALLIGLIALGYSQTRDRSVGLARTIIMPAVMILLSLLGTVSAFGATPTVLGAWLTSCLLVVSLTLTRAAPAGTAYQRSTRQYVMPGSWLPMGVILAIFMTKYAVGVTLSMQPSLTHSDTFPMIISLLYGVFSGFFAGRAVRLWRLALV
jgi:hypothetical protein